MLDKGIFEDYEKCLQDEPAATTARCPVHVDVPELCAQIAEGNFQKAYDTLQQRIPFAGIFCLVCDAPCEQACVRSSLDTPVRIGELERAAVRYGRTPFKKKFKTSKLNGKVAVVGGGISGLAASFDLDRRGYAITLFEKEKQLGGWLWELVGAGLEEEDIKEGLKTIYELAVEVRYGQLIDTSRLEQLLAEYDAVFLGTGSWPESISAHPNTFQVGSEKLFAGGTLAGTGDSLIAAVSSGKRAAVTIERFIKKISLTAEREREGAFETLLPKSLEYVEKDFGVDRGTYKVSTSELEQVDTLYVPLSTEGAIGLYTQEEARQEAARCLRCECDECIKACVHLQRYGRKAKTYAREIYTNENVFLGTRYANKMINSCTLCGLCGERCPLDICMAPLIEQTRRSMVEHDRMPPSAHDFALRDMAYSNSEHSRLVRQPPEVLSKVDRGTCTVSTYEPEQVDTVHVPLSTGPADLAPWLFFPGCQLAASEPEHVHAAYSWLRESLEESVALYLGCCGAPADWAGRDDLLRETVDGIRTTWQVSGKPTFILACSSCMDVFKHHLPEIPTVSLWHVLDEHGLPETAPLVSNVSLSIHDACTTRSNDSLQASVRSIVGKLGYTVEELRYSEESTKCCGYGGLVFYANREQEGDFAVDRAKESPHDLLVYCAMCKDLFIDAGKRSFHLLDLIFAENPEDYALRRMPTLSQRQENRAELKRSMLKEIWNEEVAAAKIKLPGYQVHISPEVIELMEERLILESDVEDALARALAEPDERFYNTADDCYLINIRKQYVTYWVRYRQTDTALEVLSVYSHRMDIVKDTSS